MFDPADDSKVGYGRPPRQHQFQPGRSGNPKGRPKKLELGIPELIEKHLETVLTIKENGKTQRVTAKEAIVRRLLHDSAGGKPKAFELLLLLHQKCDGPSDYLEPVIRLVAPNWPGRPPNETPKF
jgi:hypothetical protein